MVKEASPRVELSMVGMADRIAGRQRGVDMKMSNVKPAGCGILCR